MTVQTENSLTTALGDGVSDTFNFDFVTLDTDHIDGYVDGVLDGSAVVTLNADQAATPGGTVQFSSVPALNAAISIVRNMDLQQLTNWPVGGDFPSDSHETAADKVTMIAQQTNQTALRGIRIPEYEDPSVIGTELAKAADRANKFLAFDANGNVLLLTSSTIDPSALQKPTPQGVEDNIIVFGAADGTTKDGGQKLSNLVSSDQTSLKMKIMEIGDWNMDALAVVNVAHGLTRTNIRSLSVTIRNDLDTQHIDFGATNSGSLNADNTFVNIAREAGGTFDNTSYDSTSFNRGWIIITYV